jgi:hypothetical protein
MKRMTWILTITIAAAVSSDAGELTSADREEFLRRATVVTQKSLHVGVTASSKATLRNDGFEHGAHVQTVDESKTRFEGTRYTEMNFRDSYKFNIAAYELAKMLDLDMVPASVERKIHGQTAAFTWWVDNAVMTEKDRRDKKLQPPNPAYWNQQMDVVKIFDELIFNTDRNLGNLVIDANWQIHMIDHTRAFRMYKECRELKAIRRIERRLLASMRALNASNLQERLNKYLTNAEIQGLLARRDHIVREFDARIAAEGEDAVAYDLRKPIVVAAAAQ